MGRTTLLASTALQLAEDGKRVVAIDLDVEAPGLGSLLGATTRRGVVDFLVDHYATGSVDLDDLLAPASALDSGALRVDVIPAGNVDATYFEKLARLDFVGSGLIEPGTSSPVRDSLSALVAAIAQRDPRPDYILIDSRAGLQLAGEVMGKGPKKGYTHRWIPARLKDAGGRIVPRSFLRLFGYAAKEALRAPPGRGPLMEPPHLVQALKATSNDRINELHQEYPFVRRLANLRGQTMLMAQPDVIELLSKPLAEDGFGEDGASVFEELLRIGVLEVRSDGRIDVPDIYRYGYGIKRKGGAASPR